MNGQTLQGMSEFGSGCILNLNSISEILELNTVLQFNSFYAYFLWIRLFNASLPSARVLLLLFFDCAFNIQFTICEAYFASMDN